MSDDIPERRWRRSGETTATIRSASMKRCNKAHERPGKIAKLVLDTKMEYYIRQMGTHVLATKVVYGRMIIWCCDDAHAA